MQELGTEIPALFIMVGGATTRLQPFIVIKNEKSTIRRRTPNSVVMHNSRFEV